ncbi:MAG: TldD/PmbA family protein [Bacteroidales bacterium]|nr:TldD/PmbA family protein [Bacteroidales bacterium]MBN2757609.1 TldD/PmbA family protein [Bacteroidales bacterium]
MDRKEKEALAQYIIDLAKKNGANQIAINLSEENGVDIQYRDSEIEQLQESQQSSLSIQIYVDNKYSSHSTNDLKKESLKKFIEQAVKSTKFLSEDKYRKLPDSKLYAKNLDLDLKLLDADYHKLSAEERIERIKEIYELALSKSDKIISTASNFSDVIFSSLKVHSNGFVGFKEATLFSLASEVTIKDGDSRPEGWFAAQTRFKNQLPESDFIANLAVQNALDKIGQSKIKSGNYDLLVENKAVANLLSMLLSPLAASAIQQKRSYLDGMIGKQVASSKLSILDNPFVEKGLGSKLYDSDGIATRQRKLIDNGVLNYYFIDNYYGNKLGLEPNGGATSNLFFETGNKTLIEMQTSLKKGIFLTGFNGGNSNSTTGDFSFGISGFLIENGKLTKPINEMNISGNSKELWAKLAEIGNDPYQFSRWQTPSMLFENISFSGL